MKVNRLVSIIMLLLDKKRINAQNLADMFNVSLRTIYRDIDTIDMIGIPIRSTSGVGGGFEIMPKYKIDKNVFSTNDLISILTGLSNLSTIVQEKELINVITKVKSLIPNDKAKGIEFKTNQIYIDLSSWMYNSNIQTYFETIKKALEEIKMISFKYADRFGNKTDRIIEPYQLVLKSKNWYLQSYCLKSSDFRLFRLSRMSDLEMSGQTFSVRDYPKPHLDFEEMLATMQTFIQLRIHKSIVDRVLDYCSYENFTRDENDHYIVKFPFIENDYHYDILLSFGNKCECVEPLHIRKEMKKKIYDISNIYKD